MYNVVCLRIDSDWLVQSIKWVKERFSWLKSQYESLSFSVSACLWDDRVTTLCISDFSFACVPLWIVGPLTEDQIYKIRPTELYNLFWNSRFTDPWQMYWNEHYIKYAVSVSTTHFTG